MLFKKISTHASLMLDIVILDRFTRWPEAPWTFWHWRQARVQLLTSWLIRGQIKRAVTKRWVARIPGCARVCRAWNTCRLRVMGTNGRGTPVETSQIMATSVMSKIRHAEETVNREINQLVNEFKAHNKIKNYSAIFQWCLLKIREPIRIIYVREACSFA